MQRLTRRRDTRGMHTSRRSSTHLKLYSGRLHRAAPPTRAQGRRCPARQGRPRTLTAATAGAAELAGSDLQQWRACVEKLTQQGIATEDADELLEKAFGWRSQAYWRKQRVEEVPAPEHVDAVLTFLAEQGVDGEHVPPALQRFPEVLALNVDRQLRANVETLQSQWFVRGLALKKLLRSQPQVLGYNVDCGGNCQGDCNRCWVRF